VIAPLIGIAWAALSAGWSTIVTTLKQPDVLHAFYLTGVITVITVIVTSIFGVIVALVIARDRFPGRALMSAAVDLPLAVSPVIVGLMAVVLFGLGGWFEPWFTSHGIRILFAVPSMVLVTIFICIPFVIREVVPVLQEVGVTEEEAARTLGASSMQTFFRVTLKNIRWGLLYGIALTTARSIGEIGAVLIVSGQLTGQTETATLYVLRAFDQFQDDQGYIVALTLALVSIVLLVLIEVFKRRQERTQRT
jgi:sulfate transport system permease protein